MTVFNATSGEHAALGQDLQQKLVSKMLASNKFDILDRDSQGYYNAEKTLLKSSDAAAKEGWKLGKVLGTDYMLLFVVKDIEKKSKKSNLTGKTKLEASVVVDYRVLLFATR